jgi:hypothetical protein
MLRDRMCPEPIPSPNNIEVSSPSEQDVDYILGLYLYDIAEELEVAMPPMPNPSKTQLKPPPKPYALYYMIFINGSSQMGLKAHDVQKIIGRAAQVINDGSVMLPRQMQPWLEADESPIFIRPARISLEEKVRAWSAINTPYQVSLFSKAAPILLSSEVVIDTPRVTDAKFDIEMG